MRFIVTGSSRGIGAAIATRLARHGANVVVNYVSSSAAAEQVAEEIRGYGVKAIIVKANVSEEKEIKSLFEQTMKEFGRVDIVMSNSGIEHFGALEEVTADEIDKVFGVNVKAQYFVAQQAYKYMADNGRLVLTSSISAQKVRQPISFYSVIVFRVLIQIMYVGNSKACYICRFQGGYPRHDQVSCL